MLILISCINFNVIVAIVIVFFVFLCLVFFFFVISFIVFIIFHCDCLIFDFLKSRYVYSSYFSQISIVFYYHSFAISPHYFSRSSPSFVNVSFIKNFLSYFRLSQVMLSHFFFQSSSYSIASLLLNMYLPCFVLGFHYLPQQVFFFLIYFSNETGIFQFQYVGVPRISPEN